VSLWEAPPPPPPLRKEFTDASATSKAV
jgi:hypothetical protein